MIKIEIHAESVEELQKLMRALGGESQAPAPKPAPVVQAATANRMAQEEPEITPPPKPAPKAAKPGPKGNGEGKVVDIFPSGDKPEDSVPVDDMEIDRRRIVAKLDDDKSAFTADDCRAMMRVLARDKDVDVARKALKEFNAEKAGLVPAEARYEFIKRIEELRVK